jgi:hypothetical protein
MIKRQFIKGVTSLIILQGALVGGNVYSAQHNDRVLHTITESVEDLNTIVREIYNAEYDGPTDRRTFLKLNIKKDECVDKCVEVLTRHFMRQRIDENVPSTKEKVKVIHDMLQDLSNLEDEADPRAMKSLNKLMGKLQGLEEDELDSRMTDSRSRDLTPSRRASRQFDPSTVSRNETRKRYSDGAITGRETESKREIARRERTDEREMLGRSTDRRQDREYDRRRESTRSRDDNERYTRRGDPKAERNETGRNALEWYKNQGKASEREAITEGRAPQRSRQMNEGSDRTSSRDMRKGRGNTQAKAEVEAGQTSTVDIANAEAGPKKTRFSFAPWECYSNENLNKAKSHRAEEYKEKEALIVAKSLRDEQVQTQKTLANNKPLYHDANGDAVYTNWRNVKAKPELTDEEKARERLKARVIAQARARARVNARVQAREIMKAREKANAKQIVKEEEEYRPSRRRNSTSAASTQRYSDDDYYRVN